MYLLIDARPRANMAAAARRVLITGANKGIGLANVEAILSAHADAFVFLGSRDAARGDAARASLAPELAARCEVVPLDVTSDASVAAAAARVAAHGPLYAALLNSGVAGCGAAETMAVNLAGVKRCVDAFAPLMSGAPDARIAVVSSGVASMFVAKCSPATVAWFLAPHDEAEVLAAAARLAALVDAEDNAALAAAGYFERPADSNRESLAYWASKAMVTSYVMSAARALAPRGIKVNSASPGFISTDLVGALLGSGKSAADMGALPPSRSAPVFERLLFGDVPLGEGHYYGSDAMRSPMHRYRAPFKEPEYDGTS